MKSLLLLLRLPLLTIAVGLFSTLLLRPDTASAAPAPATLSKQTILEGVQRGVLGQLPAQFVVKDVTFAEVSRVDTEITLKGEAIFTANEDTYVATRRLGLKRPSGELRATIIRLAHANATEFAAPFQAVVSLFDPLPRIVPQLDVAAQGRPRANFKAVVIEGSPEHKKLLELDQTFSTADERFQRVRDKWSKLLKLRELLVNYDEFTGPNWSSFDIGQLLERALDSSSLHKTYTAKVSSKRAFPDRHAQHAAFIQLVKPVFDPEYARIKEIAETREAAAQAYVGFLEKI